MAMLLPSWERLQESNSTLGCDFLTEHSSSTKKGKSFSEDFYQPSQELDQWDRQLQQERLNQVFQKTTTLKQEMRASTNSSGTIPLAPPTPTQPVKQFVQINGEMVAVNAGGAKTTVSPPQAGMRSSMLRRGTSVRRSKTFTMGGPPETRGRGLSRVKERFRESFRSKSRAPPVEETWQSQQSPPTPEARPSLPVPLEKKRSKRDLLLRRTKSYRETSSTSSPISPTDRDDNDDDNDDEEEEEDLRASRRGSNAHLFEKPKKNKSMRKKIASGLSRSKSGLGKQLSKSKSGLERGIRKMGRETTKLVIHNTTAVSDYLFTDHHQKKISNTTAATDNSNNKQSKHHKRSSRPRRPSGDRSMMMQRSKSLQLQRSNCLDVSTRGGDKEIVVMKDGVAKEAIVVPVIDIKSSTSTHGSRKENNVPTSPASAAPSKRSALKQQLDETKNSSTTHGSGNEVANGTPPSRRKSLRKQVSSRRGGGLDRSSSHHKQKRNSHTGSGKEVGIGGGATKRRDELKERKHREIKQLFDTGTASPAVDEQPRLGTVADRRRSRLTKAASDRGFLNRNDDNGARHSDDLIGRSRSSRNLGETTTTVLQSDIINGEGLNEIVGYLQRKEEQPVFTDLPSAEETMRTMRTLDTTLAVQNGLTNRNIKSEDDLQSETSSTMTPARALYPGMKKYLTAASSDDEEEEEQESKLTGMATIDTTMALSPGKTRAFDFVPVAPTRNNSGMSTVIRT